jgi:hypothetical protein
LVREHIGEVVSDEVLARHGRKPMRVACLPPNVCCGREKAAKGPGVLAGSRPHCDDLFTSLPPPGFSIATGAARVVENSLPIRFPHPITACRTAEARTGKAQRGRVESPFFRRAW